MPPCPPISAHSTSLLPSYVLRIGVGVTLHPACSNHTTYKSGRWTASREPLLRSRSRSNNLSNQIAPTPLLQRNRHPSNSNKHQAPRVLEMKHWPPSFVRFSVSTQLNRIPCNHPPLLPTQLHHPRFRQKHPYPFPLYQQQSHRWRLASSICAPLALSSFLTFGGLGGPDLVLRIVPCCIPKWSKIICSPLRTHFTNIRRR